MKRINFESEKFHISKAICLTLKSFNFIVGPFQRTCRDIVIVVRKDTLPMVFKGVSELLKKSDFPSLGFSCPSGGQISY
jgi:hypothetical protein